MQLSLNPRPYCSISSASSSQAPAANTPDAGADSSKIRLQRTQYTSLSCQSITQTKANIALTQEAFYRSIGRTPFVYALLLPYFTSILQVVLLRTRLLLAYASSFYQRRRNKDRKKNIKKKVRKKKIHLYNGAFFIKADKQTQ